MASTQAKRCRKIEDPKVAALHAYYMGQTDLAGIDGVSKYPSDERQALTRYCDACNLVNSGCGWTEHPSIEGPRGTEHPRIGDRRGRIPELITELMKEEAKEIELHGSAPFAPEDALTKFMMTLSPLAGVYIRDAVDKEEACKEIVAAAIAGFEFADRIFNPK
jgi:hypothetical protein